MHSGVNEYSLVLSKSCVFVSASAPRNGPFEYLTALADARQRVPTHAEAKASVSSAAAGFRARS